MRLLSRCLALLTLLWMAVPAKAEDKTTGRLVLKVPTSDPRYPTVLTVDGKEQKTEKDKNVTLEVKDIPEGKAKTVKIKLVYETNNYTKIIRLREVSVKGGEEVTVNLFKDDPDTDIIYHRLVGIPNDIVDEMCKLAKVTKDDVVYVPYGYTNMVIRPLTEFKAKKSVGLSLDKSGTMFSVAVGAANAAKLEKGRMEFESAETLNEKSLKGIDEATVVMINIGNALGARLEPAFRKLLKPGTRIVSHHFTLGDWKPDVTKDVVSSEDKDYYTIHLWTVPDPKTKGKEPKK